MADAAFDCREFNARSLQEFHDAQVEKFGPTPSVVQRLVDEKEFDVMTDEHAKLLAEYERVTKPLQNDSADLDDVKAALWHVLKRLGPPDAGEAADIGINEDQA
jgi:hypothetical protein